MTAAKKLQKSCHSVNSKKREKPANVAKFLPLPKMTRFVWQKSNKTMKIADLTPAITVIRWVMWRLNETVLLNQNAAFDCLFHNNF